MSFTEKIVVGKNSVKVMHSGKAMPDYTRALRKIPLKSCQAITNNGKLMLTFNAGLKSNQQPAGLNININKR